jgi:hypothetical protein
VTPVPVEYKAGCSDVVWNKFVVLLIVRTSNAVSVLNLPLPMHSELP